MAGLFGCHVPTGTKGTKMLRKLLSLCLVFALIVVFLPGCQETKTCDQDCQKACCAKAGKACCAEKGDAKKCDPKKCSKIEKKKCEGKK